MKPADHGGRYGLAAQQWMERNPLAMALFEKFAMQAMEFGRPFSIGLVAERVRWESHFNHRPEHQYKVDNNHRAYIARELIRRHPKMADLLRLRDLEPKA